MKVFTSTGALKTSLSGTDHGTLTGLSDDDHTQYTKKATLTTKGDIYVATAASTPARLAVSSDALALIGSAAASEGVAWGIPQGANANNFVGTGTFDVRWTGANTNSATTTLTIPSVNVLYAYPVFLPFTVAMDRIALEVVAAGGAGSKVRCGVYASTSRTNPAPAALVYDGGEKDGTSAIYHETTVSPAVTLAGPAIYWFTTLAGTAAPTNRALVAANVLPLLGWPSTGGANLYTSVSRAFSYAALPDPFGTPTLRTGSVPMVGIRF